MSHQRILFLTTQHTNPAPPRTNIAWNPELFLEIEREIAEEEAAEEAAKEAAERAAEGDAEEAAEEASEEASDTLNEGFCELLSSDTNIIDIEPSPQASTVLQITATELPAENPVTRPTRKHRSRP